MSVKVSFADLTHTGQLVAANTFPLGIGMVASYAKETLGEQIDLEVFKYPDDFSTYLDKGVPQIACFSSFSWNIKLGHEFAKRIKESHPGTVTVFGGPNFPDSPEEQEQFLKDYPAIDCYIEFEGEISFAHLFEALREVNFDWEMFRSNRTQTQNARYLVDDELVVCELGEKIKDVNLLPSPYESGVLDKFFDDILIPMMQTTRGCPYSCAFCWEGGDYFRKTTRFAQDRVHRELRYISDRVKVSDLCIVDANFGMFKEDLQTANEILDIQKKQDWPRTVLAATAKNHKERTIEIVEMLGDTLPPTAAVQSTDDDVLGLIKRKNVSQDTLVALAKTVERVGGQSEAELILCLEGDTREKHFKTVSDMLDADMTFIRMYQFMMLPGTQSSRKVTREEFEMVTRFRVLPRCFGTYRFGEEEFPVAEIEEICIANSTMSYQDYQDCRDLHLTVEVFNNDSIFADLMQFLRLNGFSRSDFVRMVHERSRSDDKIGQIFTDFRAEEKQNLRNSRTELDEFTREPGVIDRYVSGEHGTNELYKYRVVALFEHLERVHAIAYEVARKLIEDTGKMDAKTELYLSELHELSVLRKTSPLETDQRHAREFHFDFVQLMDNHFLTDPFNFYHADGVELEIFHSNQQAKLIDHYTTQYGTDLIGLGRVVLRANMNRLYRRVRRLGDSGASDEEAEDAQTNKRSKLKLIA
jgi:radical SAM superfamily enzyme YgiQ (UPF0313 family)